MKTFGADVGCKRMLAQTFALMFVQFAQLSAQGLTQQQSPLPPHSDVSSCRQFFRPLEICGVIKRISLATTKSLAVWLDFIIQKVIGVAEYIFE